MSFGLKNVGATYQRMVNQIFKNQLGRIMEEYVDDMLVNSMTFWITSRGPWKSFLYFESILHETQPF